MPKVILQAKGDLYVWNDNGEWILFDYDWTNDIYHFFKHQDGKIIFRTVTDYESVIEDNERRYNESQVTHKRFGDGRLIANIPMHEYFKQELHKAAKEGNEGYIRKRLNDFDNRSFRTFPGKV